MRLLILTQYYPPETGAPQNRLSSLARYLTGFGVTVEILTAMPSYPKSRIFEEYRGKKYMKESYEAINIHRTKLFVTHKKGIYRRLRNYCSFAYNAYVCATNKLSRFDIVVCESPPLFLGITAVLLKRKWKSKLVFNVSDLWPESPEKMGIIKNKTALRYSYKLANWIYSNADLISGQTKGIVTAIEAMQPNKKLFWFPNGVDLEKFETLERLPSTELFHVTYAGIIGHAQGLEVILHAAKKLQGIATIHFFIIGDGPEKNSLIELQKNLKLSNLTFLPNQPLTEVINFIGKSSAYIVPLRKLDLFKGAIPSKLFEPLALSVPILLGVEGEAKELFIDQAKGGLFFEPENGECLSERILELYHDRELAQTLGNNGKKYITTNFRRDVIAQSFYLQLKQL